MYLKPKQNTRLQDSSPFINSLYNIQLSEFIQSPDWTQSQVFKYLVILKETKHLKGNDLEDFLKKWNEDHPHMQTSISTLYRYRKLLKEKGMKGLVNECNSKKSIYPIKEELFNEFLALYLSCKAPSMVYCHKKLKEKFEKQNPDNKHYKFPSTSSFLRMLKQNFTAAEINHYRSSPKNISKKRAKITKHIDKLVRNNDYSMIVASENFLNGYAKNKCTPSTFASYESIIRNHLIPYFGTISIKNISIERLNSFVNIKINDGFSKTTINHILNLLNLILDMTLEEDSMDKNPVKLVKEKRNSISKPKYLTTKKVKCILQIAKSKYPDFFPLLYTAIATGMRKNELLGLTWSNIDFTNNKIRVKKSFYRNRLTDIRTTKRLRTINISQELSDILQEWKSKCPMGRLELTFPNTMGEFLDPDNLLKRRFNPIIKEARLQDIKFQHLRNTYAYIMLSNNAALEYVQTQMGHYSVDVTFNRYGHFKPRKNEECELFFIVL
jgi:integrase